MIENNTLVEEVELWITYHKSHKLKGIASINTSPLINPFCIQMQKDKKNVCSHCYAKHLCQFRIAANLRFEGNFKLLQTYPMKVKVPQLNFKYVRFHSFGEVGSIEHAMNFRDIALANPRVSFALWTKRSDLIVDYPDNVSLVYSEPLLDGPERVHEKFHHTYVVRTEGEECGKECLRCLKCWKLDSPHIIRQLLH